MGDTLFASGLRIDKGKYNKNLLGKIGDKLNAVLAGCGFNLRKTSVHDRVFVIYRVEKY